MEDQGIFVVTQPKSNEEGSLEYYGALWRIREYSL